MWSALQTVTTVGYGDVTPTSVSGTARRRGGDVAGRRVRGDRDGGGHLDVRGTRGGTAQCRGTAAENDLGALRLSGQLEDISARLHRFEQMLSKPRSDAGGR